MLVLSRNKQQSIMIGDDVTITILDIKNGVVRLGIDAPKDLLILRDELVKFDQEDGQEVES